MCRVIDHVMNEHSVSVANEVFHEASAALAMGTDQCGTLFSAMPVPLVLLGGFWRT